VAAALPLGVLLVALLGMACTPGGDVSSAPGTTAAPTTSTSTSTTTTSTTTTTVAPTTTTTTTPPPPVWRAGDEGPEVEQLQAQLTALGYRAGTVDGRFGQATASAVMAFQKHEGLGRDGVAGPATLAALAVGPQAAGPSHPGPGPRLEVDLDRQIMFVTQADGTVVTLNVSTGNNETYEHPHGYSATAVTPVGEFAVGRKIDEAEVAPLGVLYRPMYFKGGYAVHGSTSVPSYPASHGCVRVSYEDEDWLYPQIPVGTPVIVTGGAGQPAVDTDAPAA
jgi:lipoprotein-anchoring transpeptidase ErfK/SrfK